MTKSPKLLAKFANLSIFISLMAVLSLPAAGEKISGKSVKNSTDHNSEATWISALTSIRSHAALVRSKKTIKICDGDDCIDRDSVLQVSMLVVDHGPSTDVGPQASLYLTIYNSVEETAVAQSIHMIDDIYELRSTKRIAAGMYEATYLAFRIDEEQSATSCYNPIMRATIDARALSAKVRAAKRIGFLEDSFYTDEIDVQYKKLGCPDKQ